jgi:predicted outer membrane repeat protein
MFRSQCVLRKLLTIAAGACVIAAGLAIPVSPAVASTTCNYTFPSTGYPATRAGLQDLMDDGLVACPSSGDHVIIAMTSGIVMDSSELTWSSTTTDLTLRGSVTITGNSSNRILNATAPVGRTVTIDGLSITGGGERDYGGAVLFVGAGTLAITSAAFSGNDAPGEYGGAVGSYSAGQLLVSASTFTGNGSASVSNGGAIYWEGDVTIDSSTFANNTARDGGAIYLGTGSSLTTSNSTFTGNDSVVSGGAIYADPGTLLDIQTSTLSGNDAGADGGAISLSGSATLLNSTLTGNSATGIGGAIYIVDDNLALDFVTLVENSPTNVESDNGGSATVRGSVFGLSGAGTNCGTPGLSSLSLAFSDSVVAPATDTSCGSGFTPASWSELALGGLANNGGPTQTRMPGASSVLIDLATDPTVTALTTVDQRGFARSGDYTVGAVQYAATAPEIDPAQIPPPWLQAYQRESLDQECLPGWNPSWAQWPNDHTGGWTCERRLYWNVSTGDWREEAGFYS